MKINIQRTLLSTALVLSVASVWGGVTNKTSGVSDLVNTCITHDSNNTNYSCGKVTISPTLLECQVNGQCTPNMVIRNTFSHPVAFTLTITLPDGTPTSEVAVTNDCNSVVPANGICNLTATTTVTTPTTFLVDLNFVFKPAFSATTAKVKATLKTGKTTPLIFIGSQNLPNGDLGGLSGANATCKNFAQNATNADVQHKVAESDEGATIFKAWLSSSTVDAIDNICSTGGSINFNSEVRRPGTSDNFFDSATARTEFISPLNAPNIDENGNVRTVSVWTNSLQDGSIFDNTTSCEDWMSASSAHSGSYGYPTTTTYQWVANDVEQCNFDEATLYCISSDICN